MNRIAIKFSLIFGSALIIILTISLIIVTVKQSKDVVTDKHIVFDQALFHTIESKDYAEHEGSNDKYLYFSERGSLRPFLCRMNSGSMIFTEDFINDIIKVDSAKIEQVFIKHKIIFYTRDGSVFGYKEE